MSHRIHHDLYYVSKSLQDPGNAGTIRIEGPDGADLQICEMVTAAAETRTLASPTKQGIRFILRLLTDGGDSVVTAADGLNATGNTVATFADASDMLVMISVKTSSGFRWDILHNIGAVGLA